MPKIILALHGLGNKPPNALLTQWWKDSIQEGFKRIGKTFPDVPLEMVYWADILHPKPLDPAESDPESPLFLDEPYLPAPSVQREPEKNFVHKLLASVERQLDRIFLNADMSLNFEKVTEKIIHHYFQDLETYYMSSSADNQAIPMRRIICDRFGSVLQKYAGKEILVLSHSMGTIISFDVLSASESPSVNTLVTIGSPLGLPVIVSRIFAEQKEHNKLTAPRAVRHKWYNLSDMEDMVALDHTLNDDFESNLNGVRAEDLFVLNDYEVKGERNAHKIYGYLRTAEVANILAEFLLQKEEHWLKRLLHRLPNLNKFRRPFRTRATQS